MGSRQQTRGGGSRPPALSRRAVLVGTSAAATAPTLPYAAGSPAEALTPDSGVKPYERYLQIDARISRLQRRWGRLESYLADQHDWLRLSEAERGAVPGAQELRDIDGMLDLLFEQREKLLAELPVRGATSLEVVIARLAVAERLIWRDDFPEAHAMIAGAREDLSAMLDTRALPPAPRHTRG
ncbi:MAG: helicase [Phenylobacterium sp.]|jgi:hypothetical protein|nr:helicase [Phenylobacterium sp.]